MATYRTVKELSPVDAAYIAGLIDGEGTVSLLRKHRQDSRQVVVSVSNTERPLLDYLIEAIGAGKVTGKRVYADRHTPSFTYAITNRQALDLLRQVVPSCAPTRRSGPPCCSRTMSGSPRATADTRPGRRPTGTPLLQRSLPSKGVRRGDQRVRPNGARSCFWSRSSRDWASIRATCIGLVNP